MIAVHDPLVSRVRPFLEELCLEVGETIILGRKAAGQVVYLDVVESRTPLRYTALPGQMKPPHGTASGKALLATLPRRELGKTIRSLDLITITPRTITNADQLEREVITGSARGWHVSRGENDPAAVAIAAPVKLAGEQYVLVVAGPLQRLGEREEVVGPRLVEACHRLESELRW